MTGEDSAARTMETTRYPILIVDDEEPIAETLAEFVMELGYTPLVAYNGRQALKLAREHHPVLIITDLMMPILDGRGLIEAIHADAAAQKRASPPIILSTAAGLPDWTDVHVDALLAKPFDLDHLEQLINRLLGRGSY